MQRHTVQTSSKIKFYENSIELAPVTVSRLSEISIWQKKCEILIVWEFRLYIACLPLLVALFN